MYNTSDPVPQADKTRRRSEILRNVSVSAGALGVGYAGVKIGKSTNHIKEATSKVSAAADEWKKSAPSHIGRRILQRARKMFRLSNVKLSDVIRFAAGDYHKKYVPDSPFNQEGPEYANSRRMRDAAMQSHESKRVERRKYTASESRVLGDIKAKQVLEMKDAKEKGMAKEGLEELANKHKSERLSKVPGTTSVYHTKPTPDLKAYMHADIESDITGIHAEFNKAKASLDKKHTDEYQHAANSFPVKSSKELATLKEKHKAERSALQEGYEGQLGMRKSVRAFKKPKTKSFLEARMKLSETHASEITDARKQNLPTGKVAEIDARHQKEIENLKRQHSAQEHDIPRVTPQGEANKQYRPQLSNRRARLRRTMASEAGYSFEPNPDYGKPGAAKMKLVVGGKRAIIQAHRRLQGTLPRPLSESDMKNLKNKPKNVINIGEQAADISTRPQVGLKNASPERQAAYNKFVGDTEADLKSAISKKIARRGQASLWLEKRLRDRISKNVAASGATKGMDPKAANAYTQSEAEKVLRSPHSKPLKAGGRRPQGILGDVPLEGEPLREAEGHLGRIKYGKASIGAAEIQKIHQRLRWTGPVPERQIRSQLLGAQRKGGIFIKPPPGPGPSYPNLSKLGRAGKIAGIVGGAAALGYGIAKLRKRNSERQFGVLNDASLKAYVHTTTAMDRIELKLRRAGRKFSRNHPIITSAAKGYLMTPVPGAAEAVAAIGVGRHIARKIPAVRDAGVRRTMRKIENNKSAQKAIRFDAKSGILRRFKLSDSSRRHLITGAALTGGISAADAVVSGVHGEPRKTRAQSISSGAKRGALYGSVLAGTEYALRKPLGKLAKKIFGNPQSVITFDDIRRRRPASPGAVARDRYTKSIKEREVNRHESNILRSGVAGAALGTALRGRHSIGRAAAVGGLVGGATSAAVQASNRKRKDQFGDSSINQRRAERLPYQAAALAGTAVAATSLYKKLHRFEEGEEEKPQFFRGNKWKKERIPRRWEEIQSYAKRGGRLVRDTSHVVTGTPNLDNRGRERTPEWKKPWVASAVLGTALAGGVAITKGIRSSAWSQGVKGFARNHPRAAKAHSFVRGVKREIFGQHSPEGKKINPGLIDELTGKLNAKIAAKAKAQKGAASAAAKQKADAHLRKTEGFTSTIPLINFAVTIPDWDIRDARGRSARVYAPKSQKRVRRPKKWHERKSNRDLLTGAAVIGAASVASTGTNAWWRHQGEKLKKQAAPTAKPAASAAAHEAEEAVKHIKPWARAVHFERLSTKLDDIINFKTNDTPPETGSWNPFKAHRQNKELKKWVSERPPSAGVTGEQLEKQYPGHPGRTRHLTGAVIGSTLGSVGAVLATHKLRLGGTAQDLSKYYGAAVGGAAGFFASDPKHFLKTVREHRADKAHLRSVFKDESVDAKSISTRTPITTSHREVTRELKKQNVGFLKRNAIGLATFPIRHSTNAAFLPEGPSGIIITPKQVPKVLVKHEEGHASDYRHHGGKAGFKAAYPNYGTGMLSKKTWIHNTMLPEHRAWAHAGIKSRKDKATRDAALRTYARAGFLLSSRLHKIQFSTKKGSDLDEAKVRRAIHYGLAGAYGPMAGAAIGGLLKGKRGVIPGLIAGGPAAIGARIAVGRKVRDLEDRDKTGKAHILGLTPGVSAIAAAKLIPRNRKQIFTSVAKAGSKFRDYRSASAASGLAKRMAKRGVKRITPEQASSYSGGPTIQASHPVAGLLKRYNDV